MSKVFRILSIDGGGIRGIIPAVVLNELELLTGKHTFELFDLIAGTSTGGIIALGLTKPPDKYGKFSTAQHMINLYLTDGPKIFPTDRRALVRGIGTRFLIPLFDVLYAHDGIESVLAKEFGSIKISQSLTNVLITSYEIERLLPYAFSSYKAKEDPNCDFLMKDVARATSACPVFFRPFKLRGKNLSINAAISGTHKHQKIDVPYLAFADGGVYANNPTMCGLAEANEIITDMDEIDSFLIVSLGTGEASAKRLRGVPYSTVRDHGAAWINPSRNIPLVRFMLQGASDSVDRALSSMLKLVPDCENRIRYQRFQAELALGCDAIDDARKENLDRLEIAAHNLIADNRERLVMLADSLKELSDSQLTLKKPNVA